MTYQLLLGDCLEVLKTLPDNSVYCCVTSPPYYGLRDYSVDGQIGLEESPDAYVAKLVDVFREVRRVLHGTGTLWLNLGDSYAGSGGPGSQYDHKAAGGYKGEFKKYDNPNRVVAGIKSKDLIGIPWMVALALRADGWWLRSDIIWAKPNPMPESVTDRPTKAHEYIFLLSKAASYYYDADAIAEQSIYPGDTRHLRADSRKQNELMCIDNGSRARTGNPTGTTRNRRSVWTVPTRPYAGAHFATFPPELVEPCILAGTSAKGACSACGAPWQRNKERIANYEKRQHRGQLNGQPAQVDSSGWRPATITDFGWQPTCNCNAPVIVCTVLDPFAGSGTVGAVALKHGRHFMGIELNPTYVELARRRIEQSQPMLLEE